MSTDISRQRVSILLRVPLEFAKRLEEVAQRWALYVNNEIAVSNDAKPWALLMESGRQSAIGRATVVTEAMLLGLPLIEAQLDELEKESFSK